MPLFLHLPEKRLSYSIYGRNSLCNRLTSFQKHAHLPSITLCWEQFPSKTNRQGIHNTCMRLDAPSSHCLTALEASHTHMHTSTSTAWHINIYTMPLWPNSCSAVLQWGGSKEKGSFLCLPVHPAEQPASCTLYPSLISPCLQICIYIYGRRQEETKSWQLKHPRGPKTKPHIFLRRRKDQGPRTGLYLCACHGMGGLEQDPLKNRWLV